MDTEKFKLGWALALTSGGLCPKENSKLKRGLVRLGFQKLQTNVYAKSCTPFHAMESVAGGIRNLKTYETSVHLLFLTRAQWERSYRIQGLPLPEVVC